MPLQIVKNMKQYFPGQMGYFWIDHCLAQPAVTDSTGEKPVIPPVRKPGTLPISLYQPTIESASPLSVVVKLESEFLSLPAPEDDKLLAYAKIVKDPLEYVFRISHADN